LQYDSLGQITTLQEAKSVENRRYPTGNGVYRYDRVPDTQRCFDLGFVTSIVAAGTFPEKLVFVAGNKGIYASPPRFQFGVAKFHFTELTVSTVSTTMASFNTTRHVVTDAITCSKMPLLWLLHICIGFVPLYFLFLHTTYIFCNRFLITTVY
jgi:hypothetical protein